MTGLELLAKLERAGVTQAELARRCGWTPRYVSMLVKRKQELAPETNRQVVLALALRPRILLSREDRAKAADLLVKVADGVSEWSRSEQASARRLSGKLVASVGGTVQPV